MSQEEINEFMEVLDKAYYEYTKKYFVTDEEIEHLKNLVKDILENK